METRAARDAPAPGTAPGGSLAVLILLALASECDLLVGADLILRRTLLRHVPDLVLFLLLDQRLLGPVLNTLYALFFQFFLLILFLGFLQNVLLLRGSVGHRDNVIG